MSNPAELLHNILAGWFHDPKQPIYTAREINGSEELMQKHRQAVILIGEIEQILGGMNLTETRRASIQRNLAKWTKWVFAYPHNWLAAPNDSYPNLWDQDALDALDFVAQLLETQVPEVDEARRSSYLENINEIIIALNADDSLPPDLRKHIYTVASHARHCIEEYELTGDFALQAAVERLAATVQAAIKVSTKAEAWQKFRDKFVYPTVAGLVASGPQLVIAASGAS